MVGEVRKVRSELKINPGKKLRVCLNTSKDNLLEAVKDNLRFIYETGRSGKDRVQGC